MKKHTNNQLVRQHQVPPATARREPRHRFDHHRLDVWWLSLEAMVEGFRIAKALPRGFGKLKDQLERALSGQFTQTSEAAARTGADRQSRYRIARAEAGEAAAVIEGLDALGLIGANHAEAQLERLWRICAMLTRLAANSP